MRGVGLTLVSTCALACAQPPQAVGEPEVLTAGEGEGEGADQGDTDPGPAESASPSLDASLAHMRTQVRGGRLPEDARRGLLDSANPDHRHAARLLQAIAGEVPAAVLPRTAAGVGEPVLAAWEDQDDEEPAGAGSPEPSPTIAVGQLPGTPGPTPTPTFAPNPSPTPTPTPTTAPNPSPTPTPTPTTAPILDERDAAPFDVAPALADLVPGSPAWAWFASGSLTAPTKPEREPSPASSAPATGFEGELPLLLREPLLASPTGPIRNPAPLVILTRLDLRPGSSEDLATLELAGAGPVAVTTQPLSASGDRLRLWIADAGAVPAFTGARPTVAGVAVLAVDRRDRQVWIEVELAPGWALQAWQPQPNGATVSFARLAPRP
jgi:hypothetical protein